MCALQNGKVDYLFFFRRTGIESKAQKSHFLKFAIIENQFLRSKTIFLKMKTITEIKIL